MSEPIIVFLWRFDSILGHGHPLLGYAITMFKRNTLGMTPLDE
jgi:hypothetical protein